MTLPETQELQTTRRQRIDKDRNRKKIERNRAKKLQQVEAELRKKNYRTELRQTKDSNRTQTLNGNEH